MTPLSTGEYVPNMYTNMGQPHPMTSNRHPYRRGEMNNTELLLIRVMDQCEADFKAAHTEICKLQGLDPATHDWPSWTTIANTRRWFDEIRASIAKPPLKLHFTNEWLKAKIEADPEDTP